MTATDALYLALIAALLLLDSFVLWPAFLRRFEGSPGRARTWLWSTWMGVLWALVAAVTALWFLEARSWEALRFVVPHGWRLWVAIGLVLAVATTSAAPILRIARSQRPVRIKMGNPTAEKYVPHTRSELGWWVAASLSAGFGEELLFRGYLIWVFEPLLGLWGAAALAVVVFAAGHAYQGARGIVATGVMGSLFTLVVLILGSLLPAMVIHATVDLSQGIVAWLAFREIPNEDD